MPSNLKSLDLLDQAVNQMKEAKRPIAATPVADKAAAPKTVQMLSRSQQAALDLTPSEVVQGLSAGDLVPDPTSQYQVVDPQTNEAKIVVGNELTRALDKGFTMDAPENAEHRGELSRIDQIKLEEGDSPWSTFGKTAVDEALFGLPKHLMSPEQRERFEIGKEVNPTASGLGAFSGIGASILATGGVIGGIGQAAAQGATRIAPRLAGKLAVSAAGGLTNPVGALGRAGAKAITTAGIGTVESVAFELPRIATEAAFGDPKKAGEQMLLAIGLGASLGGVIGGGHEFLKTGLKVSSSRLNRMVETSPWLKKFKKQADEIVPVPDTGRDWVPAEEHAQMYAEAAADAQAQGKATLLKNDVARPGVPLESVKISAEPVDWRLWERKQKNNSDALRKPDVDDADNFDQTIMGNQDGSVDPLSDTLQPPGKSVSSWDDDLVTDSSIIIPDSTAPKSNASRSMPEGEGAQGTMREGSEVPEPDLLSIPELSDDQILAEQIGGNVTKNAPWKQGDYAYAEKNLGPGESARARDASNARKLADEFGLIGEDAARSIPVNVDAKVAIQELRRRHAESIVDSMRLEHAGALKVIDDQGVPRRDWESQRSYLSKESELGSRKSNMDTSNMSKSQRSKQGSLDSEAKKKRYDDLERDAAISRKTPFSEQHGDLYREWLERRIDNDINLASDAVNPVERYLGPTYEKLRSIDERISMMSKLPEPNVSIKPEPAELDLVTPPDKARMADDQAMKRQRKIDEFRARQGNKSAAKAKQEFDDGIGKMAVQPKVGANGKIEMVVPTADLHSFALELGAKSDAIFKEMFEKIDMDMRKAGATESWIDEIKDVKQMTKDALEEAGHSTERINQLLKKQDDRLRESIFETESEWAKREAERPKEISFEQIREILSKKSKGLATDDELRVLYHELEINNMAFDKMPKHGKPFKKIKNMGGDPNELELEGIVEGMGILDQEMLNVGTKSSPQWMKDGDTLPPDVAEEILSRPGMKEELFAKQDLLAKVQRANTPTEVQEVLDMIAQERKVIKDPKTGKVMDNTLATMPPERQAQLRDSYTIPPEEMDQMIELRGSLENELKLKEFVASALPPSALEELSRANIRSSIAKGMSWISEKGGKDLEESIKSGGIEALREVTGFPLQQGDDIYRTAKKMLRSSAFPASAGARLATSILTKSAQGAAFKRSTGRAPKNSKEISDLYGGKPTLAAVDQFLYLGAQKLESSKSYGASTRVNLSMVQSFLGLQGTNSDPRESAFNVGERMRLQSENMQQTTQINQLFGHDVPQIASEHDSALKRNVNWLAQRAPKKTYDPLYGDQLPTLKESETYMKQVEAGFQPASVIRRIDAGTLTPVHVEAMKAMWPHAWEDVTAKLAQTRPVTSTQKHSYSIVFGQSPNVIDTRAVVQGVMGWGQQGQPPASPGNAKRTRSSKMPQESTLSDRLSK